MGDPTEYTGARASSQSRSQRTRWSGSRHARRSPSRITGRRTSSPAWATKATKKRRRSPRRKRRRRKVERTVEQGRNRKRGAGTGGKKRKRWRPCAHIPLACNHGSSNLSEEPASRWKRKRKRKRHTEPGLCSKQKSAQKKKKKKKKKVLCVD